MLEKLINEFLTLNSPEIKEIKENATILGGFLTLAKKLDSLEKVEKRFYEWSRSLYQATATDEKMETLENILKEFFGLPIKPVGKGLPLKLRLSPSVKQLNGLKSEQALFIKKLKTGEFYGALFPWQKDSDKIEIHLGFSAPGMTEGASAQLATVAKKYLSKSAMDQMNLGVGGAIHGISLPSFLQMSEMEGSTYKLKVSSSGRIGYLNVNEGQLIGAQTGEISGKDAAYKIISWDKVVIEIEELEPSLEDDIQMPLMHVLMESLKIKDEASLPAGEDEGQAPLPPDKDDGGTLSADAAGVRISGPTMGPFERVPPPAPVVPKKKNKAMMLLVGSAISLPILLVGGLVGSSYFKKLQQENAYQEMMSTVASEIDPEIKERELIQFLDKYNAKKHLAEIDKKIKEVRKEIATKDYEEITLRLGTLPIDEQYEAKAAEIYNKYLAKHPDSRYKEEIQKAILGIRGLVDDTYYQKLLANEDMDMGQRFDAYQDYLNRFPDGIHRDDVEKLLADMGEQYYSFIKTQAKICDQRQVWDKCIVFCQNYVKVFDKSSRIKEIKALKRELSDKEQFYSLQKKAEKLGENYIDRQNLYRQFLADNPGTTAKSQVLAAIEGLKGKVADQKQWLSLKSYAGNANYHISDRLRRLEIYLDKNNSGPYSNSARDLYEKLLIERVQISRNQKQLSANNRKKIQRQVSAAQRQALAVKVAQVGTQFAAQVNAGSDRFRVDGLNQTFKDSLTGYNWALLDSNQHFDYCLNYEDAVSYVKTINWGGYSDWRLPTSQELATLYKKAPFFPESNTPWYWTSEAYAKGYHFVANIVTSKHEKAFTRKNADQNECGAVRAIRP